MLDGESANLACKNLVLPCHIVSPSNGHGDTRCVRCHVNGRGADAIDLDIPNSAV